MGKRFYQSFILCINKTFQKFVSYLDRSYKALTSYASRFINERISNDSLRKVVLLLWSTLDCYAKHKCPVMAAGMSFFGIVTIVPLSLIAISTMGYILGSSETAQEFVYNILLKNFPSSAVELLNEIHLVISSPERSIITGLSFLGLIWSGIRFFNILQSVLNTIWVGAKQDWFLISRAKALLTFTLAGMLFWASFLFKSLLTAIRRLDFIRIYLDKLGWFWHIFEIITPLLTSVIMIFLIYVFVPHAKVKYQAALLGSVFASVSIEVLKLIFSFIIVNFSNYGAVYGSLAGLIIFMSWVYISMQALLFGAELGSQFQRIFFLEEQVLDLAAKHSS